MELFLTGTSITLILVLAILAYMQSWYFITGLLIAIAAGIGLLIYGKRNGWLSRILRLPISESSATLAEKNVQAFIGEVNRITNRKRSFAARYQNPDDLAADFIKLPVGVANRYADELERALKEETTASQDMQRACNHVLKSVNRKLSFGFPDDQQQAQPASVHVETPSGKDPEINDYVIYSVDVQGSNVNVSGSQIKDWMRRGGRPNVDFFIRGVAATANTTTNNGYSYR